jgi:hypothetical protein
MLQVKASPRGGQFIEFLRIDITAFDDGVSPVVGPPFEILYTTDGSVPSDTNPSTKIRRSPITQLPINGPTTLKFFARNLSPPTTFTTSIVIEFYDVLELTARNEVPTVGPSIRNYTLTINDIGDLVRTSPGQYDVVFGIEKTKQDIRESILVENVPQNAPIGDRTLPKFGSALNRILGQSLPVDFAANEIQASIFDALTTLMNLQQDERVPSDEQIRRIISVTVVPLDPTSFRYYFMVETVSGQKVSDSGTILV